MFDLIPSTYDDLFARDDGLFPRKGFFKFPFIDLSELGRTDIVSNKDSYTVKIEMPGFKKEDIAVTYDNGTLSVEAKSDAENKSDKDDNKLVLHEIRHSSVSRKFNIPDIAKDKISAKYENGVLNILLPKLEEEKSDVKKIDII